MKILEPVMRFNLVLDVAIAVTFLQPQSQAKLQIMLDETENIEQVYMDGSRNAKKSGNHSYILVTDKENPSLIN